MTVNKSQGQPLNRVGVYLPESYFTHGQLYVAFSRCGFPPDMLNRKGLKIVINDTLLQGRRKEAGGVRKNRSKGIRTPNIVLNEVFR